MTVDVDPVPYYAVGTALRDTSQNVGKAAIELAGSLNGTGSMAGSDEGGRDWGDDYDSAASSTLNAVDLLTQASHNFGVLVQQAAYNHAVANFHAQYGQKGQGPYILNPPPQGIAPGCPARPPSSVGDSGPGIQTFVELLDKIDVPVPNGAPDQLDNAATAWDKLAAAATTASEKLTNQRSTLDGITSPEINDVRTNLTSVHEQCTALAENAKTIAQAARDHASELRQKREEIKKILIDLAKEIGVDVVITIAVSFITWGAAAVAGTAAVTKAIGDAAVLIKNIIDKLKELLKLKKAKSKLKEMSEATKKKLGDLASKQKKEIDDAPKKPDEPTRPAPRPEPPKSVQIGSPKEFDPQSVKGMAPDDLRSSIPSNWERVPSKSGDGEVFRDPSNPGRQIRIMPGYPPGARPDPLTGGPYAVISQNGGTVKVPLLGNPTL